MFGNVRTDSADPHQLYSGARDRFSSDSLNYGTALLNEGLGLHILTRLGVEPVAKLWRIVELYSEARERFSPDNPNYGSTLINEGIARVGLADLGEEPMTNLERALGLHSEARARFSEDIPSAVVH